MTNLIKFPNLDFCREIQSLDFQLLTFIEIVDFPFKIYGCKQHFSQINKL